MNQEAEGTGVARQGAGGGHPAAVGGGAASRDSRSTGPQQVASNRAGGSLLGRGLTPGQRPNPGQPPPAEPLASSPYLLNALSQDQGMRGTILVRAQPHSRGMSAFRVLS